MNLRWKDDWKYSRRGIQNNIFQHLSLSHHFHRLSLSRFHPSCFSSFLVELYVFSTSSPLINDTRDVYPEWPSNCYIALDFLSLSPNFLSSSLDLSLIWKRSSHCLSMPRGKKWCLSRNFSTRNKLYFPSFPLIFASQCCFIPWVCFEFSLCLSIKFYISRALSLLPSSFISFFFISILCLVYQYLSNTNDFSLYLFSRFCALGFLYKMVYISIHLHYNLQETY